jgi:hypothetical protein
MAWPEIIRIEVKISTREAVPLPARALESLAVTDKGEVGILAALFWCGDRNVDGRWLIADAEDTFRRSTARTISVSKARMEQANRGQPWLGELKEHVARMWPPFLQAFFNDAMQGHDALCEALQRSHEHRTVGARLTGERVLEADHRDAIRKLFEHHGESLAGHVFQDLFAYLVGYAGYANVLLNPVGVPDVTVSGFHQRDSGDFQIELGRFSVAEVRQLLRYCEQSDDHLLAERIRTRLSESERSPPSDDSES